MEIKDIPALVQYFMERKSKELGLRPQSSFSPKEIGPLLDYDWPGNVRELENVVERALIQQRSGPLLAGWRSRQSGVRGKHIDPGARPMPLALDDVLSAHIRKVLEMTGGKVNGPDGAASLLRTHPNTLRNRMNKLGIPYGRHYGKRGLPGSSGPDGGV
jgi:hydrogenase-4 transcriptional activator